jgi:Aspartyl protease
MPSYAKFLKEMLSNKKKLEECEIVALTVDCSALLLNQLPPKIEDPSSFTLPCSIGNVKLKNALCDPGASVSLMPKSIFDELGIKNLKPTRISLQLADRPVRFLLGIIEDIPVQVGKLFVPGDFIVMKMEEDNQVPIILGRPFLATAGANLDMKNGILSLAITDEKIEFNVTKSIKYPSNDDVCCRVEAMDTLAAEIFNMQINMKEDEVIGKAIELLEKKNKLTIKSLTESHDSAEDSEEKTEGKTPQLELKSLPPNLRYEFLDLNKAYPVIVGAHLDATQTVKLLHELRLHKKAIRYSIEDLKRLNPSLCMHRILLEEDHKPSREP